MMGKTHMTVGAITGAGLALALNAPPAASVSMVLGSIFGALLPDLDAYDSTGAHMIYRAAPLAGLAFFLLSPLTLNAGRGGLAGQLESRAGQACIFALLVVLFPSLTAILLPHRGPTHSVLVWLVLMAVSLLWMPAGIPKFIVLSLCAGSIFGGILPDAVTRSGVPALWPIRDDRLHVLPEGYRLKTGSLFELLLVRPVLLVVLGLLLLALLKRYLALSHRGFSLGG
jgi:membrane-bound metal-dependent hydrolase YbcI (DUF457 family)